jgi:hypothetical protein
MDFGDLSPENTIVGADGTVIGNVSDALKVTGDITSVDLGLKADAVATTDTGTFSLIALFKRLLQKIPTLSTISGALWVRGEVAIDPAQNQVTVTNAVTIVDPTVPASATDTLTALNDTVVKANTVGIPVIMWQITGTWVATIVFEVSNDNSNWFAIEGYNTNGWSTFTSTTANGMFLTDVPAKYIRVRMSAYTSGTATVVYQANNSETPFVRARLSQASSSAGVSATDRIITTETDHQFIHQGLMFSLHRVYTALNNAQVVRFSFTTGASGEHFIYEILANFEIRFKLYEGSVTTKGATLTEFNRSRSSANVSLCTAQDISAVTSSGTLLSDYIFGATGGGASSVFLPRGSEFVLKTSTEYMVEVTSLQNNNDVTVVTHHYRTSV